MSDGFDIHPEGCRCTVHAPPSEPTEAERFAQVLRDESVRRVDDRYVHHAVIRTQMRTMADTIERWERGDFRGNE